MWLRSILNRLLNREEDASPRVVVAAFGKHPGWDDHIEDIGLSTDALIALKRWLYAEGIRPNIDGGAWEKLPPEQRLEGFSHVFVWRRGSDVVVGRMWSSQDGKGRTRYPMIVCAHFCNVSAEFALEAGAPALDSLQRQCEGTTNAGDVVEAVGRIERELQERAAAPSIPSGNRVAGLADLAGRPEMGPDRRGLHRILYQVEREMSAYRPRSLLGETTRLASAQPRHMRVPACADTPMGSIRLWMAVMLGGERARGLIAGSSPLLVLVPLARCGGSSHRPSPPDCDWVDLVVGVPSDSQLSCIRAGIMATPLATDVPYAIEESFIHEAERKIEQDGTGDDGSEGLSQGGPYSSRNATDHDGNATIVSRLGAFVPGSITPIRPMAAAAVLVVLALAVWLFVPSSQPTPSWPQLELRHSAWTHVLDDRVDRQRLREIAAGPDGSGTEFALESLRLLIDGIETGAIAVRPTAIEGDEQHQKALDAITAAERGMLAWLDSMDAASDALDEQGWPTAAADLRGRAARVRASVAAAQEGRPQRVADDERAADRLIDDIADASVAAMAAAEALAVHSALDPIDRETAGQSLPATVDRMNRAIASRARGADGPLHGLAQRIEHGLMESRQLAGRITAAAEHVRTVEREAEGDPLLAHLRTYIDRKLSGAASDEELASLLDAALPLLERVDAAFSHHWSHIDHECMRARSEVYAKARAARSAGPDANLFEAWVDEVEQRRFVPAPSEGDPRAPGAALAMAAANAEDRFGSLHTCIESDVADAPWRAVTDRSGQDAAARYRSVWAQFDELAHRPWNCLNQEEIIQLAESLTSQFQQVAREIDLVLAECCEMLLVSRLDEPLAVEGSAVLAGVWRGASERLRDGPSETCMERRERAERIRSLLVAMDSMLPPAAAVAQEVGATGRLDAKRAIDIVHERREQALERALRDFSDAGPMPAEPPHGWSDDYERWRQSAGNVLHDYARLNAHLDELRPFSEAQALLTAARSHEARGDLAPAIDEIEQRLAELDALPALEPSRLREIAARPAEPAHRRFEAWRLLGRGDPPTMVDLRQSLGSEIELQEALRAMAAAAPEHRRGDLLRELAEEGRSRWVTHAMAARSADSLEPVLALSDRFGIRSDELDEPLRGNLKLHARWQRLRAAHESGDIAATAHELETMISWLDGMDSPSAILGVMRATLEELLAPPATSDDFATRHQSGPGSIPGWELLAASGGASAHPPRLTEHVVFRSPNGRHLAFRRVELPDGRAVYVGTHEVPVGVFIDVVNEAGGWSALRAAQRTHDAEGHELRRGVRTWELHRSGAMHLAVAPEWYPAIGRRYVTRPVPPRPTETSPAQFVSPATAMFVASRLGCRLPGEDEWRAALDLAGSGGGGSGGGGRGGGDEANLRGMAFFAQWEYLRSVPPNEEAFRPESFQEAYEETPSFDNGEPHEGHTLWFHSVYDDEDNRTFRDLIGNVAEFVLHDPDEIDARLRSTSQGSSPRTALDVLHAVREYSAETASVFVIGGSSLSHPNVAPETAYSVTRLDQGYADVGFRLAFRAGGMSDEAGTDSAAAMERLAQILREPPYLLP